VQPSTRSSSSSFSRLATTKGEGDNDGRGGHGDEEQRDLSETKEKKRNNEGNPLFESSVNTGRKRDNRDPHSDHESIHDESSQDDNVNRDRVSIQLIVSVGNNDLPADYHIPDTFNQWSSDLYSLWREILPPDEETK
ncbi:ser thr phosphatase family protein, partial [Cystoisospora suis]